MDQDEQIKQLRAALENLLPLAQQERNRLTSKIDEFSGDQDIIASDACSEASRVLADTRPDDSASRIPDAGNKALSITPEASAEIRVLYDSYGIYGFGETGQAALDMARANFPYRDFTAAEDASDIATASPALASELQARGINVPCRILVDDKYVGRVDEDGPRVAAHFGNELYVVHFTPELVQKHMAARYPGAPYQTAIATEKCAQEYFLAPGNDGVQLLADGRLGTLNEGEQSPVFAVAREAMMKRHSLEHLPESVHYRSMEPAADTLQRHDKERDDLARRFSRIDFSMDSPWGKVEDGGWIVKGHCYTVDTARHGGVRVSEKVNQEIPEALRDEEGWYEEDRAWSIPFAFSGLGAGKYGPVESPFYSFESACETASRYYPEEYRKLKMPPQLDQLPPAREDVELHSRATDSTELFKASANGHTDTLKTQIEALFHARAANNEALRLASSHGDTDTVKALLDAGADVNADYDVALRIASRNGHTETVKALIAAGADVHKAGGSAIWAASGRGHIETVKALLEAGADVHDTNEAALRLAVDNRHAEVVRTLLEAGADVHVSDGYALSEASFNGYTEIVKVLLDAGAILGTHYDQALRWASGNGHTETVKLLLDAGADLHVLDDLPLRGASAEGHTETVKLLIDAGANVGARNQEALRLAAEKNQVETVRALLKAGADVRVFDSPAKQLMRQMYHAEKDTRELVRPSPELVSGAKDSAPEKTADRERIRSTDSKLLTPQERAIQRRMLVAEAAADRPTPEPGHER